MCGIVGAFHLDVNPAIVAMRHRGPDASGQAVIHHARLGHTRLAIVDLDHRSDQPFHYVKAGEQHGLTLVYNGELWNYKDLRTRLAVEHGHVFQTTSDTEVLAAALWEWGIDALPELDGMFAFAWTSLRNPDLIFLARDRFGEMPLHLGSAKDAGGQWRQVFASEYKALQAMGCPAKSIHDVPPGHTVTLSREGWAEAHLWYDPPAAPFVPQPTRDTASARLYSLLETAVLDRMMSDVPICTLLSGGLDSSIVAYFLARATPLLTAYTAVYDAASRDLRLARRVAAHLRIRLIEVPVPTPTADDLAHVVSVIEMPHKAQIEIGWPCLKLAERMQADGCKVTFSGEGSDELFGSYGLAYHGIQKMGWHAFRKDSFLTQARKNFMRANKIFMGHSVECRLPFLHYPLVEYVLGLSQTVVADKGHPKAVLAEAFRGLLPDEVLDRPKVAFQDGLGLKAAIPKVLADPRRFYRVEYDKQYNVHRAA